MLLAWGSGLTEPRRLADEKNKHKAPAAKPARNLRRDNLLGEPTAPLPPLVMGAVDFVNRDAVVAGVSDAGDNVAAI